LELTITSFKKNAFYLSLFLAFAIWFFSWCFLPISVKSFSSETLLFITASLTSLILGYIVVKPTLNTNYNFKNINPIFKFISIIVLIALTCRVLDLIYFRSLWFENPFYENKRLGFIYANNTPFFISAIGTLRALYFVPLLLLIITKSKNYYYWLFAVGFILVYNFEILLFGTRKPLFQLFLLIIVTLLFTRKRQRILSKKGIAIAIATIFCLSIFSFKILNKRVTENNVSALVDVTNSRYNDFVKINPEKLKQFKANPTSTRTKTELLLIHTGQYIVHGFYELDYIINNKLPRAKGIYSFNPFFRLTNKLNITNLDLSTKNSHPREYVYTSFFGSFFIDFGWFSLILFFVFGMFQKLVFNLSKTNIFAAILWLVLIVVNLTMPIFNLMAGSELYLNVYLVFLLMLTSKFKFKNNIT
jgi:hypothetical protein